MCLPGNPEEVHKHEESTWRFTFLPNLLSLPLPCFPQPHVAEVIPGRVCERFIYVTVRT